MMVINLADYSRTAAQRGWGAGWPSCAGAAGRTVVVISDRSGTRVSVHERIARLVDLLIDWTERADGGNYLLKPAQCGGYNCRAISGTNSPSNHSWALAVDLNWNDNPYTTTGRHTLPTAVARRWNRYGFAWGGDYSSASKDWMHLEFMGFPVDADAMTALAIRELTPTPPKEDEMELTTGYKDWAGNDQTVRSTLDNLDKRLTQLASDADKAAAKRVDLGYMRDQLRGDVASLDTKFTAQVASLAGELAEIKALLLGKDQTT